MPPAPVSYQLEDSIATIVMDDGKANLMTQQMQQALGEALDRAQADGAVVLLCGRERFFSGGYDRAMFQRSAEETVATVAAGGALVERILGFPRPVVAACTGHAVAQGAFLLLAADLRVGASGEFKIGMNEVAIGLTIPHYAVEIARFRLSPPWFNHGATTGTLYTPSEALSAGFVDRLVPASEVVTTAREEARRLTAIDMNAHAGTKQRVRGEALARIRDGLSREFGKT